MIRDAILFPSPSRSYMTRCQIKKGLTHIQINSYIRLGTASLFFKVSRGERKGLTRITFYSYIIVVIDDIGDVCPPDNTAGRAKRCLSSVVIHW